MNLTLHTHNSICNRFGFLLTLPKTLSVIRLQAQNRVCVCVMGQNGKSNCRLLAQLAETPAAATQPSHMDPQGQFTHPTTPQPSLLPLRLWVAAARSQRGV